MPVCCVPNCKSRSSGVFNPYTKFFRFPKDEALQVKWLEVCKRKKEELKLNFATVCEKHFKSECIEERWTKPRSADVKPRIMRRLKQGSIPTEALNLTGKLKEINNKVSMNPETKLQKKITSTLPSYTSLVNSAKQERKVSSVHRIVQQVSLMKQSEDTMHDNMPSTSKEAIYEMGIENRAVKNEPTEVQEINYLEAVSSNCGTKQCGKMKLLQEQIEILEEKVKDLEKESQEKTEIIENMQKNMHNNVEMRTKEILGKVFTPGQIKKLLSPTETRIQWTAADISSAIALQSISAKAYKYLREVKNIPLPCVQTLRNWSVSFNTSPGILNSVLEIMAAKGRDLSVIEKIAVLSFDEMSISNGVDLERGEQKIYGPHKSCSFVLARGLFSKWKQPLYYQYDEAITKEILFRVILSLHEIAYTVVAIVCDSGSRNMALWKDLDIGVKKLNTQGENVEIQIRNYFINPADNTLKIFAFSDAPHLIKLARNHLFDSGFHINSEYFAKDILEDLLKFNRRDLKIAFKLTREHLDVKGHQRQKVKLAAQIFSTHNAAAIEYFGAKGFFPGKNWQLASQTFKLFNDWFDVFNSQNKYGNHSGLRGYGVELDEQNKIITNMDNFISVMRVGKYNCLLPFQKGILINNQSLRQLLEYLKTKYTNESFCINYIITRKLCQDALENFLSYIRCMSSTNDHSSPIEVKSRLKWYILGKHSSHVLSVTANTEGDNTATGLIDMQDISWIDSTESYCDCVNDSFVKDEVLLKEVTVSSTSANTQSYEEEEQIDENASKISKVANTGCPKNVGLT